MLRTHWGESTAVPVCRDLLTLEVKLRSEVCADEVGAIDTLTWTGSLFLITRHRSLKSEHVTTEAPVVSKPDSCQLITEPLLHDTAHSTLGDTVYTDYPLSQILLP